MLMKSRNILIFILLPVLLLQGGLTYGQLRYGGVPASTVYAISDDVQDVISVKSPDMNLIRSEDEKYPSPYRFAVVLPVNISTETSGVWEKAPDGGGSIWRVTVTAPGALAMSAYFDKFVLPEGGKVFLYNADKTQVIGAFTARNNVGNGYFATELIAGDRFTIEYDEPLGVRVAPLIHIYAVDYAYRGVDFLNSYQAENPESTCEVNVKCPEGDPWQYQVASVMRIKILKGGSSFWCSGSLVNNVRNNHIPYVLTADHCFAGTSVSDLQQWIFYFGYEYPTCANQIPSPYSNTMTGATLKAHGGDGGDTGSDFCLVLLNQNIPDTFNVFFNGWNRKDTTSPSGVCVHHPAGGVKKISTYDQPLVTDYYIGNPNPSHWRVSWIATPDGHGVTEGGSSGSPLFDNFGRVVGTLTGGDSFCDSAHLNAPDYYGKFSWSWDKDGVDSTTRLKDWLDPDNTGILRLVGLPLGVSNPSESYSISVSPNPFTDKINLDLKGFRGKTSRIELLNLMGLKLWSESITPAGSSSVSLSFPGLPSGMYFLRILSGGNVSIVKLIRQ
jgi:hypothetical protein